MDIEKLKNDIEKAKAYKAKLENRQVDFPLDPNSLKVIHKNLLVPTGNVVEPYSLASYTESVEIIIGSQKYLLNTTPVQ